MMIKHQKPELEPRPSERKRTVQFRVMRDAISRAKEYKQNGGAMLSQEFVDDWADALESGDYEQGQYKLYHKNTANLKEDYCCLGVACLVLGVWEKDIHDYSMPESQYRYNDKENKKWDTIEVPRMLVSSDHAGGRSTIGDRLATCNDKGWSFSSIAKFVRRYLGV